MKKKKKIKKKKLLEYVRMMECNERERITFRQEEETI